MKYKELLTSLFSEFPDVYKKYQKDDSVTDLPHCVFDLIVYPYISTMCIENNIIELNKLGGFLEKMSLSDDINVVNILNVSLLELFALDKEIAKLFKPYMGEKTRVDFAYWE